MAIQSAWQEARLRDELARGEYSKTGPVARALQGKPPIKSPPSQQFENLNATLSRELQKAIDDIVKEKTAPSRDEVERAAAAGATLHFNGESSCFASLSWESDDGGDDGTVTAVFTNGFGPYEAPLDLDTFLDWCDGSAGKFFNAELGRDFFAATKQKGE